MWWRSQPHNSHATSAPSVSPDERAAKLAAFETTVELFDAIDITWNTSSPTRLPNPKRHFSPKDMGIPWIHGMFRALLTLLESLTLHETKILHLGQEGTNAAQSPVYSTKIERLECFGSYKHVWNVWIRKIFLI